MGIKANVHSNWNLLSRVKRYLLKIGHIDSVNISLNRLCSYTKNILGVESTPDNVHQVIYEEMGKRNPAFNTPIYIDDPILCTADYITVCRILAKNRFMTSKLPTLAYLVQLAIDEFDLSCEKHDVISSLATYINQHPKKFKKCKTIEVRLPKVEDPVEDSIPPLIKQKQQRKKKHKHNSQRRYANNIGEGFYQSSKWKKLRYEALKRYGARCCLCGRTRADGIKLHVDHIKPKSKYPNLAYDIDNLQILCEDCNLGKSNQDQIKWRDST